MALSRLQRKFFPEKLEWRFFFFLIFFSLTINLPAKSLVFEAFSGREKESWGGGGEKRKKMGEIYQAGLKWNRGWRGVAANRPMRRNWSSPATSKSYYNVEGSNLPYIHHSSDPFCCPHTLSCRSMHLPPRP